MSTMHATISAWQRQHEDGSYTAEISGWTLKVKWRPEGAAYKGAPGAPIPPSERRGFQWEAERDSKKLSSDLVCEEIELAMAQAEHAIAHADEPAADAA